MAKKTKTKAATEAVKPPIKGKPQGQAPAAPVATIAASAMDPYLSASQRAEMLPSVGEGISSDRVQSVFAHLMFMSVGELNELLKRASTLSILEVQIIRLLLRTTRDLPNRYAVEKDENGNPIIDPKTGKPVKKLVGLHKQQLQNESQAMEAMRYVHERAFGKPKAFIEHSGLPTAGSQHVNVNMVLAAMDNLPKNVVDAIAIPAPVSDETKE